MPLIKENRCSKGRAHRYALALADFTRVKWQVLICEFEFVKSVAADLLDAVRVAAWQKWSAFVRCLDLNRTGNVSRHETFPSSQLAGVQTSYIGIVLVDEETQARTESLTVPASGLKSGNLSLLSPDTKTGEVVRSIFFVRFVRGFCFDFVAQRVRAGTFKGDRGNGSVVMVWHFFMPWLLG